MTKKVVVLHSGGLDSTVCLLLAKRNGLNPVSLGIEYGQRHVIEMHYAASQCLRFGIERHVIRVAWEKPQRVLPQSRSVSEIREGGVSTAFLPARNAVFLVLAAAQAAGLGATEIWTGINSVDFSGYPDCRPEFVEAFEKMLQIAAPGGPAVVAPLQTMSKPEIAALARSLKLTETDTWSCYRPQIGPTGVRPCGVCDACVLHKHAWAETT
jgi:7-cyano-7-deazaguanine synthase